MAAQQMGALGTQIGQATQRWHYLRQKKIEANRGLQQGYYSGRVQVGNLFVLNFTLLQKGLLLQKKRILTVEQIFKNNQKGPESS